MYPTDTKKNYRKITKERIHCNKIWICSILYYGNIMRLCY